MATILGKEYPKLTDERLMQLIDKPSFATKTAIWSLFEVCDYADQVAIDKSGLTLVYSDHWGEAPVSIKLPDNPTWRDMCEAADTLIQRSGDLHHVYVENFKLVNSNTIHMVTGS